MENYPKEPEKKINAVTRGKIRRSAHDISRGKLERCFDARAIRANHDADEVVIKFLANELREMSFYLGNLRNV